MKNIFFHTLFKDGNLATYIAIAETEPVDKFLEIKKFYYTASVPAGYEYPWNIGTRMINWKEDIKSIGTYVFEVNNIDLKHAYQAIEIIFKGVK